MTNCNVPNCKNNSTTEYCGTLLCDTHITDDIIKLIDNREFKNECLSYLLEHTDWLTYPFMDRLTKAIDKNREWFLWRSMHVSINKGIDIALEKICPICEKPFHGDKVIDHNKKTMKVRYALHSNCNFHLGGVEKYGIQPYINVYDKDWLQNAVTYLKDGCDDII